MKIPFIKSGGDRFRPSELAETTAAFPNPARGWYQIHTFRLDEEPDLEEQKWCLNPLDSLVMVLASIRSYQSRDLDEAALERLRRILQFFADRRRDCILRVVYDNEGRAPEREPFFFQQILTHLRQVSEAVRPFSASVFVFQGMLVGNWGEMHTSRFLTRERLPQMAEVLRAGRGAETWLAVRRPDQWRLLHRNQAGGDPVCSDGITLFDDGMFGSPDHLGTFGIEERSAASWDARWRREDELAFENVLFRQAPNGGEAVYGREYALRPEETLAALRSMQVTYLNRAHDRKLLDLWGEQPCPVRGVWAGESLLDYIGAHLGYRLLVRSVRVTEDRKGGCLMELEVENTGFAAVYQEGRMSLEYTDGGGALRTEVLEETLRGWQSGEVRRYRREISPGEGALLLRASRDRDGAVIRFGNQGCGEDGKLLLGRMDGRFPPGAADTQNTTRRMKA